MRVISVPPPVRQRGPHHRPTPAPGHPAGLIASLDREREETGVRRLLQVQIFTDSANVADSGNDRDRGGMKNAAIWNLFDVYYRNELILNWN
ncbi:hypothetical protein KIH39_22860 [Telmatocola sphagniphila]|uniref:Uncharacterized protein n=1 Tax=Telmatocola sphagniphila TaxID=1123043 RepID=A0A8E6B761_9BACT|nr:hypothetical protein [Telmatocola sphagniphila]QVL31655.1 hypothetical protein KIH39_22860 [Telmatocola sphagniphila]